MGQGDFCHECVMYVLGKVLRVAFFNPSPPLSPNLCLLGQKSGYKGKAPRLAGLGAFIPLWLLGDFRAYLLAPCYFLCLLREVQPSTGRDL